MLPDWLARPMLIEHDLQKHSVDVDKMKQLDSLLVKRLQDDGVMRLFPGKDLILFSESNI